MKRSLFGIFALALAALAGCNPLDRDRTVLLLVTELDAPETIAAGSPLTVTLTVVFGGCVTFDRISVERVETGAFMAALGRDPARGSSDVVCPQQILTEMHSHTFDPPSPGTFTIHVERGRTAEPIVATVQVQ